METVRDYDCLQGECDCEPQYCENCGHNAGKECEFDFFDDKLCADCYQMYYGEVE